MDIQCFADGRSLRICNVKRATVSEQLDVGVHGLLAQNAGFDQVFIATHLVAAIALGEVQRLISASEYRARHVVRWHARESY